LTLSRILAYTSPSRGNLYPLVPVLDELRQRGHEVALRTLAGEVEAMRSRGFEAAPIAPEIEALAMEDWRAKTVTGAQVRAMRTIRARAPHDSRDLLRAIEDVRPGALIVDVLASGALTAAASWDRPWSCYRPFPLPSSRVALACLGISGPLSAAPLHLYMSAEPFEYPNRDWPDSVVMVGPCAWEPEGELPAGLAGVEGALVLVTTSTDFQDDGRLVEAALEGLADEPLHVVATVPAGKPSGIGAPANATVLRFAPHSPILARAACAITHGGMGATQKALTFGVPVCAVPFGRDQPEVAQRVEVAGAGSRLPARRLTSRRLKAKVREAISCRAGAERVAKAFAEAGGASRAADTIERRLL
jgi:UDP:flavonoid glycosyltransferase YjiC (YdhE family)